MKDKASFQIHNYFPPPKIPFVINLASLDNEIADLSIKHVNNALSCCSKLGAKYYSFHAGFLCDIKVNELNKKVKKRKLYDRKKSTDLFLKRVLTIAKNASDKGISIMIENNVFSETNKNEFKTNPLLMAETDECIEIIKQTPKNVKLLLDVAHLKVSANSLAFDPIEMMNKCKDYIGGYHLSDNNGLSDTNQPFLKDAWFMKYLRNDLDYYSIEVYKQPINEIKKLKDFVSQNLFNKSK